MEGIEGQIGFLNRSGEEFWEKVAATAVEVPTAVRFGRLSLGSPRASNQGLSGQAACESSSGKVVTHHLSLPLFTARRKMGK